jgi:hypothetical protein
MHPRQFVPCTAAAALMVDHCRPKVRLRVRYALLWCLSIRAPRDDIIQSVRLEMGLKLRLKLVRRLRCVMLL